MKKLHISIFILCTNMYDHYLREGVVKSKVVVRDAKYEKRVKASRFNFHRKIVESFARKFAFSWCGAGAPYAFRGVDEIYSADLRKTARSAGDRALIAKANNCFARGEPAAWRRAASVWIFYQGWQLSFARFVHTSHTCDTHTASRNANADLTA